MRNSFLYFLEMVLLIPVFPILYVKGKKLKKNIVKLPSRSNFLKIAGDKTANNLLIIGESTAAGVGASSIETTFAAQIFRHTRGEFTIFNIGENGLKAESLMVLFGKSEKEVAISISKTIILIGANDCFKFTAPWKFKKEMESFIAFLTEKKGVKKVIIPLIPPVQEFPLIPGIMRFFLGWHRRLLTRELQILERKLPHLSFENHENILSDTFFSVDGIHPSDYGYEHIAASVAEKINNDI
jgi:lysophospholipase L1-like esterase